MRRWGEVGWVIELWGRVLEGDIMSFYCLTYVYECFEIFNIEFNVPAFGSSRAFQALSEEVINACLPTSRYKALPLISDSVIR